MRARQSFALPDFLHEVPLGEFAPVELMRQAAADFTEKMGDRIVADSPLLSDCHSINAAVRLRQLQRKLFPSVLLQGSVQAAAQRPDMSLPAMFR
jgi:hypothetical protein